jgi:hypothetical protein
MHIKNLFQKNEFQHFTQGPPVYIRNSFFLNNFLYVHFVTKLSLYFEIYAKFYVCVDYTIGTVNCYDMKIRAQN